MVQNLNSANDMKKKNLKIHQKTIKDNSDLFGQMVSWQTFLQKKQKNCGIKSIIIPEEIMEIFAVASM